ncbi:MAG TPA: helix-turn-helix domain-containing protein [Steroidobacteraceae bacterium]|jgi:AcrR family transcriptional regulator|nr:helix-turn-helix domain-containing protein [Steroidobacteraceae bacterium]
MAVRERNALAGARPRSRTDSSGDATRNLLIEKALELFADHGIDAVSLRQIGVAIGSGNASVVAYHFGSKRALLKAIIQKHVPQMEAQRAALLAQAVYGGRDKDLFALLEAMCRPVFEQRATDGRRRYAGLLWHLNATNWWSERSYSESTPALGELLRRIAALLPRLSQDEYMERMSTLGDMMAGALRRIEHNRLDDRHAERIFTRTLRLGCMVLLAHD